jgi:hypothetical protein
MHLLNQVSAVMILSFGIGFASAFGSSDAWAQASGQQSTKSEEIQTTASQE